MQNKKNLIALLLVALLGVVGGTFAYYTSSAEFKNEFQTGTYNVKFQEQFVSPDNWTPGTETEKKVSVTNTGGIDVVARAKFTESWLANDKTTALTGVRTVEETEYKAALFDIGTDWVKATDGYYYYTKVLKSNETSQDFISSVTFNEEFPITEEDVKCTETTSATGLTEKNCTSLTTGYAGATYTLTINVETIQADAAWAGYKEVTSTP